MNKWRLVLLIVIAFFVMLPAIISSIVWGCVNIVYAFLIVVVVILISFKKPGIAKLSYAPLAILLVMLPHPYWLFMDNKGIYSIKVNHLGLQDSWGFLLSLGIAYFLMFWAMSLLIRKQKSG